MSASAAREGKWSLIISALMKPLLYFQSANNNTNEDSANEIIEVILGYCCVLNRCIDHKNNLQ